MCNISIRNMNEEQLNEYIDETTEKINSLVNEFSKEISVKVTHKDKFSNLKEKAFGVKNVFKYVEWINKKMKMDEMVTERISTVPKRGEIWTCELGQNIGSEENKVRPVIVIQNNTGNEKGPTTIIVPISNRHKKIKVHIQLRETDYKLVAGEAQKVTGTVLCEQIKVVSKVRLGRHIATLEDEFLKILDAKLKNSLDL
ncbi:type II toxin-antitoxin system PemK/MazF family toxin [Hathewaya limosa]|uniref:mRNA interferase MazF n=1 Tax=Hathewaya limosa TaxID=1536 RepID=A0ABU0JV96_HATLI|nr:type II toxin-antitoxin system PemK/MazF family toxin [Hathewaya limosa]MDQ0481027.1 mRNA interferase MazF [Hathewaya limosa]